MTANPDSLFETAQGLLDILNYVYMEYTDEVATLPSRQIVVVGNDGSQPHDCEQVVCYVNGLYPGQPGNQDWDLSECDGIKSGSFTIEIVRSTAVDEVPVNRRVLRAPTAASVTEENRVAKIQLQDMVMLYETADRAHKSLSFLQSSTNIMAGQESGQYQAMIMNLHITV